MIGTITPLASGLTVVETRDGKVLETRHTNTPSNRVKK